MVTTQMSHIELQVRQPEPAPLIDPASLETTHIDPTTGENDAVGDDSDIGALEPIDPKLLVGLSRNAPCPCGSGKKVKHCHGAFI